MIPDDDEHHERRGEVDHEVEEVIAPRPVRGDRVIERVSDLQDRTHVDVLAYRRQREGIDEVPRGEGEASDPWVPRDAEVIVEKEADIETVRVGDREGRAQNHREYPKES